MFIDPKAQGEPLTCHMCKNVILERPVHIDGGHSLPDATGDYHASCAKPVLSIKRAHDAMMRGF